MNNQTDKPEMIAEKKKKPYFKKKPRTQQGEGFNKTEGTGSNKTEGTGFKKREGSGFKNVENKEKKHFTKRPPKKQERIDRAAEESTQVERDEHIIFGRNAVIEILKSGRDIDKILIQTGQTEGSIKKIIGEAKAKAILVQEVEKSKLDELSHQEKHQGVVAYAAVHKYSSVDEMLNDAKSKGEDPFILILDNIQDPHNLGAIMRSAHNAGVHGIIIPKRRAVGLTSTVAKSSAGAIEYMKVAKVSNIAQTIEELKTKGIWIACADMDGEIIYQENLRGPIGIVIGSEGDGISRNVKNKCDFVVSVPMYGKVTSLNASVAASILAYEVVRQRLF